MYDFPLPYTTVVFNTFFQTFRLMGVLTKRSMNFDRNHRSKAEEVYYIKGADQNDVSYHAANLNIFGRFVFEIFLKNLTRYVGNLVKYMLMS